ncbi:MAG: hypothetical protein R6V59_07955 [Dehalococcoidia bacterium]
MKKILLIAVAAVLAIGMVAVGCNGDGNGGEREVITLDFATFWPSVDFQVDGGDLYGYDGMGHTAWMDAITAEVEANTPNDETGYTVEWNTSFATPPPDLWAGVTGGTIDVITSGPGYTGGIMPLWEGPEYAAALNRTNAYTMTMTVQELYDTFAPLQDTMDDAGVKVMHFWSTGPGYFLMVDGEAVTVLEDFPGKKIRTANPASVLTVNALGAEEYSCAMSDAYEALRTGLADGILCPTDTPKGFSLDDFVTSATFAPFSYQFVFMKVMNPDAWDDLPSVVQDVFNDVNAAWPEYYGQLRTWGEADGLTHCEENVEDWNYYDPRSTNNTEYQRWVDACVPGLINDWIGDDETREWLWGNFTTLDAQMTADYGDWTPSADPPEPPY